MSVTNSSYFRDRGKTILVMGKFSRFLMKLHPRRGPIKI